MENPRERTTVMDFKIQKCGRDIDTIVGLIQAVYEQMEQNGNLQ